GDGGGVGLAPARHTEGGGHRHADVLASAGGPGELEMPAAAGAQGGVDKPGNGIVARKIPEFGGGADPAPGANDFRQGPKGIAVARGGGIPTVSAARARGTATQETGGTGPKIA